MWKSQNRNLVQINNPECSIKLFGGDWFSICDVIEYTFNLNFDLLPTKLVLFSNDIQMSINFFILNNFIEKDMMEIRHCLPVFFNFKQIEKMKVKWLS